VWREKKRPMNKTVFVVTGYYRDTKYAHTQGESWIECVCIDEQGAIERVAEEKKDHENDPNWDFRYEEWELK
jgi:hypothetical protein